MGREESGLPSLEPPPCSGPTPFTAGIIVTSCLERSGRAGLLEALMVPDGLGYLSQSLFIILPPSVL